MKINLLLTLILVLNTYINFAQTLKINNKIEQEYTKYFREFIPIKESIYTVVYSYEKKYNTFSIKGYNPALKLSSDANHEIPKDFYYFGYDSNPDSSQLYFLFYNEETFKSIIAIYDTKADSIISNTFELVPFREILNFSYCEDYFFFAMKDRKYNPVLYEISIDLQKQNEIPFNTPKNIKDYFYRFNTTFYNAKEKCLVIAYSYFNHSTSRNYIKSYSSQSTKSINIEIPEVEEQFAKYYNIKNLNDSIYIIYGTCSDEYFYHVKPFETELMFNGLDYSTGNFISFININTGRLDQHFLSFNSLSNINSHISRDVLRETEEEKRLKKNSSGKNFHYEFRAYSPQLILDNDKIILVTYVFHSDETSYKYFNFLLFESFNLNGELLSNNSVALDDYSFLDGYDGVTIEVNGSILGGKFMDLKKEKLLTCHNSKDYLQLSYLGESNLKFIRIGKEKFDIIAKTETPYNINEEFKAYNGICNSHFIEDSMFFIYGNITVKKVSEKAATYISLIRIEN